MRKRSRARTDKDGLETLLALHQVALETMSHGLLMVDRKDRVVLFNQSFLDMCNLSAGGVRRGMTLRALFAHVEERNDFGGLTAKEALRRLKQRMASGEPVQPHVGEFRAGMTFTRYYWQLELDEDLSPTGRDIVSGGPPAPR